MAKLTLETLLNCLSNLFLVRYDWNWWLELSWKGCVKTRHVGQQFAAIRYIFNCYFLDVGGRHSSFINTKVVNIWLSFPKHQESSNLELWRPRYDQNTTDWSELYCQLSIADFDFCISIFWLGLRLNRTLMSSYQM